MKKIILGLMMMVSLSFASATIFKGTTQSISINSSPEGAKVYLNGQLRGSTPLAINVKKGFSDKEIRIEKNGYNTQMLNLEKSFDKIAILSLLWDYSTTDLLTGAVMEYEPNTYHIELKKK